MWISFVKWPFNTSGKPSVLRSRDGAAGCDVTPTFPLGGGGIPTVDRPAIRLKWKTNRECQDDNNMNGGKAKTSGLVGVLLSTAFPLHPDCCHYCQLAQHMAHGTWLMMAHYVSLIKSRSSEISHEAGDGIAGSLPSSPLLSWGVAIIKEHNLLNLMDTCCGFWEVFKSGMSPFSWTSFQNKMSHDTRSPDCCSPPGDLFIRALFLIMFTFLIFIPDFNLLTIRNEKFPWQTHNESFE